MGIAIRLLLLLLLVGLAGGVVVVFLRRKSREARLPLGPELAPALPEGPEARWERLAARSEPFREALATRRLIRSLVEERAEDDAEDTRYEELLQGVDLLLERIAHNLEVLEQTDAHLATFEPARLADKEADLRHRLGRAQDEDARRLIESSLRQLKRQQETRQSIRSRSERLLSGVEHTIIQLQAVHLDLINVFSAGIQSEAGQLLTIRTRIDELAEDLGRGAQENDEFARLLLEDQVETVRS